MILEEYINFLNGKKNNLEPFIHEVILKNKGYILGVVKRRLFNKGIDGNGNLIGPAYSKETILRKKKLGQRSSFVTLRNKGDFYKGMFVEFTNKIILINSTDEKTSLLVKDYGKAILELTDQEIEFIIDSIIEPEVNKFINDNDITIDIIIE